MNNFEAYFNWSTDVEYFLAYFIFAGILTSYLVFKSESKYKLEIFFIFFYLITGNINKLLTIKIPGFSLLEIQPLRIVYLLLFFLVIRKTILSRTPIKIKGYNIPWFQVALFFYIIWLVIAVLVNSPDMIMAEVLEKIIEAIAFLAIIYGLQLMADKPSYDLIGKAIIIGAVLSSIVSLVQLFVDPYFLRIGDDRGAFGSYIRSNGIFTTEYFNSYYLIIAITWVLTTLQNKYLKIALVCLFSIGVLTSFQRMSWIILAIILIVYFIYIERLAIEKMVLIGLSGLAILLSLSIFYYQDVKSSSLFKERISDSVDGRKGYYALVLDNIGEKPLFGYGDLTNDVYYNNMLRITGNRKRATAESGDLHSGYFSALFLYGVPAFISFMFFVSLSVIYYARLFKENNYFTIPLMVSVIYLIGNLTNTFLFLKYIAVLYAIHIGIGMGINKIRRQDKTVKMNS
ncbi:O-antigen ligase family protein [Muriicola sp. Z0-33]|uniref:O-antigen ligase family protein n=1 Tax=Muriicola sp. Z0-33 TaxID=2816957 RepID=UPI002237F9B0|nr:O-antigen ligase family protein [Muriicola sp. Z0-33]MCW5515671.1 O-antigen ligase family protein [Muriicola sp. Z0-33]